MLTIPLSQISLSKTNPRRRRDEKLDAELAENVKRLGVLQPVLVRPVFGSTPKNGTPYELVAGSRRFAAAKAAGLTEIPAISRELSDVEALEVQVVENLQRADVHPLEEAEGYRQLSAKPGYDVATVAERVGRSAKYVYDRMKLLALTKEAKHLFLDDRITAGHAILLARLKPVDQARAIEDVDGLFQTEHMLWDPEDGASRNGSTKPRSVRELQVWIDTNVRFDVRDPDPMLFPETAEEIARAQKVVPITFANYIPPEARDGKTFGPRSWKRADGLMKSKKCDLSTTGVVMIGLRRGEAFAVCVAKEKCTVHWGDEIRARKKRVAEASSAPAKPEKQATAASIEAARLRGELDKAIGVAIDAADKEADGQLAQKAAAADPESFIRAFAKTVGAEFLPILKEMGEKVSSASAVDGWISRAPIAQVQRAIVIGQTEFYEDEIYGAFAVDRKALRDRHEREAREKFKAQASAQKKQAKPKKAAAVKKGGSK